MTTLVSGQPTHADGKSRWRIPTSDLRRGVALLLLLTTYGAILLLNADIRYDEFVPVASAFSHMAGLQLLGFTFIVVISARATREANIAVPLFWLVIAAIIAGLTIPIFGIFKQLLLPARGFPWDASIARIDRALFLGVTPWHLTHWLFGTVGGTLFFDRLYSIWMVLMFAFPSIVATIVSRTEMRFRLLSSWILVWIAIGTVAAWALASAGPCYYNVLVGPDADFARLTARLQELQQNAQLSGHAIGALDFQPSLLAAFRAGGYAPAGGISAMPSVHVAMATLFAIGGFAIHRRLGRIMVAYALLIWIGSVHLGWHYALDGLVASALTLLIWQLTGWLNRLPLLSPHS